MYNGKFRQCLEVLVECNTHDACLYLSNLIKKQCDAWVFCVRYDEFKSARKGDVLKRTLMIYQTAYAGDIVIFKEAIRRLCYQYNLSESEISFTDRGSEPTNDLRESR
jgi:hypothetical protein